MRFDSARRLTLAAALALAVAPAAAQELELSSVPEHLLAMVGDWRLEQEDPALPACAVTLTEDATDGGWAVALPQPCGAPYPAAGQLAAWNVDEENGSVMLMDAAGRVTLRLFEGEDGLFMTGDDVAPTLYLVLPWDADGFGGEAGDEIQ